MQLLQSCGAKFYVLICVRSCEPYCAATVCIVLPARPPASGIPLFGGESVAAAPLPAPPVTSALGGSVLQPPAAVQLAVDSLSQSVLAARDRVQADTARQAATAAEYQTSLRNLAALLNVSVDAEVQLPEHVLALLQDELVQDSGEDDESSNLLAGCQRVMEAGLAAAAAARAGIPAVPDPDLLGSPSSSGLAATPQSCGPRTGLGKLDPNKAAHLGVRLPSGLVSGLLQRGAGRRLTVNQIAFAQSHHTMRGRHGPVLQLVGSAGAVDGAQLAANYAELQGIFMDQNKLRRAGQIDRWVEEWVSSLLVV